MKKPLLFLVFLSFFGAKAQKVDLDRFYFNTSYQILPREHVDLEKRTYASNVKLGGALQSYANPKAVNDKIYIEGWKKVEENPTVSIELNLEDFVEKGVTPQTRVEEKKDKDGKLISRVEYYYIVSKYTTRGYATVKGPITPTPLTEQQIEAEKAKQASVASNRFLKNAVVKKDTTAAENDGFRLSFNGELEYKSKEYSDDRSPMKEYILNKSSIRDKTLRDFADNSLNSLSYKINSVYGFRVRNDTPILWILDAKSEEGQTQIEAIQAVKALFATMKATEPITDLKANMQPLIEYFDSLKTKYTEDSKPARKMRYSAYYNLAVIYLMLDEPEKSIAESEKLIANDYDKSDGKGLIEQAKSVIESFKLAKTNTRHNPALK